MDGEGRRGRARSFLLGGLVGASAAVAAARRRRALAIRRRERLHTPAGLAAFETAPCFREIVEQEAAEERDATSDGAAGRAARAPR